MSDSNTKDFTVTTVSGKTVQRNKCRFIQKEYYEINADCFFMPDNRWHRINNGKIAFDNEDEKWVMIENTRLLEGVIGIDENNNYIRGYFSPNPLKNTRISELMCISDEIPIKLGFQEEISSGIFYPKGKLSASRLTQKGIGNTYSFSLGYSAGPSIKMFADAYNEGYTPKAVYKTKPKFPLELKNTSWGLEIETHTGFIPERLCFKNGIIPLRDGSLRHDGIEPFEFTTIPLSGTKGLYTVIDTMEIINKYTEIGKQCAFHLHIGGYEPSKEFVIALHRVMIRIQDELYSLFPSNYRFTSENGFKAKDYCAPVKNIRLLKNNTIDQNFDALYNYYSGGNGRFSGFGACNHPMDRDNRSKWNIEFRYVLVNIIPLIWGGSGTCEFRLHPPSQNIHKIANWLYICNAIMAYVQKHKVEISNWEDMRNVNLDNIFKDVYSSALAETLSGYIQWRKDYMVGMDRIGEKELKEDLMEIPFSVLT